MNRRLFLLDLVAAGVTVITWLREPPLGRQDF